MYDTIFAALVRLSGVRFVLHHDSYAYLDKRRRLTDWLMRFAGLSAIHIVCCDDMKERLLDLYGRAHQMVVASNVTNTESPTLKPRPRPRLKTIGLISHLARSKGVLEFLDVADRKSTPEVVVTNPLDAKFAFV